MSELKTITYKDNLSHRLLHNDPGLFPQEGKYGSGIAQSTIGMLSFQL